MMAQNLLKAGSIGKGLCNFFAIMLCIEKPDLQKINLSTKQENI